MNFKELNLKGKLKKNRCLCILLKKENRMSNFLIINKILCFNLFILVNKIRIKCKAIFEFNLIFIKVDIFLYFVVSETG